MHARMCFFLAGSLGGDLSAFSQQLMSDPVLSAARQFGGQYAEQQKEKVGLVFLVVLMPSSDRQILIDISSEVLFRSR